MMKLSMKVTPESQPQNICVAVNLPSHEGYIVSLINYYKSILVMLL